MTDTLTALTEAVAEYFSRCRTPGLGLVGKATEPAASPGGGRVAFTAHVTQAVDLDPVRRVAVLDTADGSLLVHDPGEGESFGPQWSPSGDRLAWIATGGGRAVAQVSAPLDGALHAESDAAVPGTAEFVLWSPAGTSLLVGAAEPGAELSDVIGSGRLADAADRPSWAPEVTEGTPTTGWRHAWVHDLATGAAGRVSGEGTNVWQAAWAGEHGLLCVTSRGPGESDWYGAELTLVDLTTGSAAPVLTTADQVALPAAAPSGERLSAVVGAMSDRGLYAGRLTVLDPASAEWRVVDTEGVDVTDQVWLDDGRLVFAGLRGLETVVGLHAVHSGETTWLWRSDETCGDLVPTISATAGAVAAVVHGYTRPHAVALITGGRAEVRLELDHDGTRYQSSVAGTLRTVRWTAPDSTAIEGLLALPDAAGPHALVVNVHGGPVAAWRNGWSMQYPYTPLLVAHGYAVLHANARGSVGYGQDFVRAGLLDMGGADADDFVSGLDALVESGLADPERVGITGNSYGGYMAAWLAATSDRFAAAVIRSPVTDWVSQHHASNLPGFDERCLSGDPLAADSVYRTRSPLYLAGQVRTPVLLMAGANDLATPPEQATMFHRALVERGRPSTLVIYPEEGHGVRHHPALVDQCARMLEFFDRHLPTRQP